MNQDEIFKEVRGIIAESLSVDEGEIHYESNIQDDLGADSLDIVELAINFEEAFDIKIPDEIAEEMITVKDAINFIENIKEIKDSNLNKIRKKKKHDIEQRSKDMEETIEGNINDNSPKNDYSSNITSKGDDLRYDLDLDFEEAVFGVHKEITIPHLETCELCKGQGRITTPRKMECSICEGNGVKEVRKKFLINIPPGVDKGTKLRVTGEGNVGKRDGTPGDLYIFIISVKDDSNYRREGETIFSEISINYRQAILGDTIKIKTVDGLCNLKIPSGTQPNTNLSLKGKGVPRLGNPNIRGNHQVLVRVKLPTQISEYERNFLEGDNFKREL